MFVLCFVFWRKGASRSLFFSKLHIHNVHTLLFCLDSLLAFFLFVVWGFCTKKKKKKKKVGDQKKPCIILPKGLQVGLVHKKSHALCEDGPRVLASVVARFLERASTRRSLALFAERGSFRNPLGFLHILLSIFFGRQGVLSHWDRADSSSFFFPRLKDWVSKKL